MRCKWCGHDDIDHVEEEDHAYCLVRGCECDRWAPVTEIIIDTHHKSE